MKETDDRKKRKGEKEEGNMGEERGNGRKEMKGR